MAAFCLAADLADLESRLGRIDRRLHGATGKPVTAAELKAEGAMTALLKDALKPNLVQTLEGSPALVHGGPFANIAHGCNSVVATRAALKLGDYVVTEAGLRRGPRRREILRHQVPHGGVEAGRGGDRRHGARAQDARRRREGRARRESLPALKAGFANLARHIANVGKFGAPVVVAVNRFTSDTEAELDFVRRAAAAELGVKAIVCDHWARGGAGCEDLAHAVAALADGGTADFRPLYPDAMSLLEKTRTIAREIYGADDIAADDATRAQFRELEAAGWGDLPVCVAKTQYSFSDNPSLMGAPTGHTPQVREVRLRAGAGFVVVLMGDIRTMPGLPRFPAAERIRVIDGEIQGLF